ncbi:MAG: AAA family ATPase [Actinomycetales bacterium]|nr:MAG: AAA family ATPase [Actinomycetales bacterium]
MYLRRLVDIELDELLCSLPAIALDGPKGVGKTETASQRAKNVFNLDEPRTAAVVKADPDLVTRSSGLTLIDEWQRVPAVWDVVRRAVDQGAKPGSFLLTGSATPAQSPSHSGAGRIVSLRIRPMALSERGSVTPTISIAELLDGRADINGHCEMNLVDYTEEIIASGFPAIRSLPKRARRIQLSSYLTRALERDLSDEQQVTIRRPATLHAWIRAYAAASSSTASWEAIRTGASDGDSTPASKTTAFRYKDWLTALWLLDEIPAWYPAFSTTTALGRASKHQLADPALAASLLQTSTEQLLDGKGRILNGQTGTLLGALFESLATLTVRAAAQSAEAKVSHLRTKRGDHEVDLIVERYDGKLLGIEVKLAAEITAHDVKHLSWFKKTYGDRIADCIVINTGNYAYRRKDGIAVIPLALLT